MVRRPANFRCRRIGAPVAIWCVGPGACGGRCVMREPGVPVAAEYDDRVCRVGGGRRIYSARARPGRRGGGIALQRSPGVLPRDRIGRARRRHRREDRSLDAGQDWNGDFQPAASGFAGGTIGYGGMAQILKRGAATANTNRGHDGGGPWKLSDMNDVPYHLMVEQAKSILSAYYGSGPKFTVMNECGGGGSRDALMEVQSWPADLDAAAATGIVYYSTHHGIAHMWVYQATHKTEASYIPPSKYPMIHQGALDACDAKDGLVDGVIEDPERCRFDPGVLLCKNGDAPDCLTAPQVTAVRTIYSAPVHAKTGKKIYGSMPPGGELGWEAMAGPTPYPFAPGFYRQLVFDQNWDYKTHPVNFDTDVDKADAPANLVINANNPDLRKFIARGGKLMLVGGWNDHTLGPGSNVDYYESVVEKVGAQNRPHRRPALHGARHGPLPGGELSHGADRQLRRRRRAEAVENDGQSARSDRRDGIRQRQARSPAPGVCVSPGQPVQGIWCDRRSSQLRLQGPLEPRFLMR